jgi:ribose 1,5-bisphosphokinase PhnN
LELDAKLTAYLEASCPSGDGKDTDLAIKAIIETIGNEARSEAQRVETRVKQVESENKDD